MKAWLSSSGATIALPWQDRETRRRLKAAGWHENLWRPARPETAPAPTDWVWLTTDSPYSQAAVFDLLPSDLQEKVAHIKTGWDLSWQKDAVDDYPCPPGEAYMPFQRAGIQYVLSRRNAIIADEMGLGKTVQALGVANATGPKKILVVCPASVRLQWAAAARRWLINGTDKHIVPILDWSRGWPKRADMVIVSYDGMRNADALAAAMDWKPDLLVLDEAHFLKTRTAKRTQAMFGNGSNSHGLVACCGRVLALTGTPLLNKPSELYGIVRALDWDAIDRMTEARFLDRYSVLAEVDGNVIERSKNETELQFRLRSNLMIRRTKAEVADELPAKTYEVVELAPNGAIRKALQAEAFLDLDLRRLNRLTVEESAQLSSVRREMGLAKVPLAVEHIVTLLEAGTEKLVVFAWHRDVIASLAEQLEAKHKRCVTLTGSTPAGKRMALVNEFIANDGYSVFIAQLLTGGVGIDGLQKATSVGVIVEPSWTHADNEQAADRLHRSGQDLPVTIQFLVAPGSLDQRVLTTALRKAQTAHAILDRR